MRKENEDGTEIEVAAQQLSEDDTEYLRDNWQERGLRAPF
jgi:hypothetical protein